MDRGAWWAIYSLWGHKESDTTEQLSIQAFLELGVLICVKLTKYGMCKKKKIHKVPWLKIQPGKQFENVMSPFF